ncbi:hypothetical protein [Bacteroides propionicifaciens]|jgi:hypothetical protein|uniref:hypothetical protein n=1 Tax=Bacteroides propionicifaciens TaxID=392838 RepID=UPI00037BA5A2|nr:hypothetical protein [Bacteroides propionicifaciens]
MKKLFFYGLYLISVLLFLASSLLTAYSLAMGKAVFAHCLIGGLFLLIGLSLFIRCHQIVNMSPSVNQYEPNTSNNIELHRNWERLFYSELLMLLVIALISILVFSMIYFRLFVEKTTLFD